MFGDADDSLIAPVGQLVLRFAVVGGYGEVVAELPVEDGMVLVTSEGVWTGVSEAGEVGSGEGDEGDEMFAEGCCGLRRGDEEVVDGDATENGSVCLG